MMIRLLVKQEPGKRDKLSWEGPCTFPRKNELPQRSSTHFTGRQSHLPICSSAVITFLMCMSSAQDRVHPEYCSSQSDDNWVFRSQCPAVQDGRICMVSEHGNNPELQRPQQRILFLLFILSPLARGSFWQPVYLRSQKTLLRAEQSRSWEKLRGQLAAALTAAPPTASTLLKDFLVLSGPVGVLR